jgi:hypothetical protein
LRIAKYSVMRNFIIIVFFLAGFSGFCQYPPITLGNQINPVSVYRIIVPVSSSNKEYFAAKELQRFIELTIGYRIEIHKDDSPKSPVEIVVGKCARRNLPIDPSTLAPDEFFLKTDGSNITILGGSDLGLLYGIYYLAEKYLGCRFYAPGAEEIQRKAEIRIPVLNYREKPAFQSREVYYAGMADSAFCTKMRCNRHAQGDSGEWGMWVHTMFKLVPPDKYFDSHPEYYALMAGKRQKTQLCLTNPDVLKITIEELGKMMKEKPGAKFWSVSQMDTYGSCECPACRAIDEREGSASGTMIEFVNKVAAAFPDKVISTLAYQYTRSAPKHIKPASNVNIMLCTIECDRSRPIDSDTARGSFYADLRDWSKITNNILVWDYVIQFTNMIAPFPNFHVLQPNLQLFKKFNVWGVFEQGCHGTYSENQELRQYVLAKLLVNPYLNLDSLISDFFKGYYGNGASPVRNYNTEMQKAQIASGMPLLIYGSPVQETQSFLQPELIKKYDHFFDDAEFSTTLDPVCNARAKKARLPIRYAKLEIARKNIIGPDGFLDRTDGKWSLRNSFLNDLDTFVVQANRYGVKSIHERGLTPDQYRTELLASTNNAFTEHLALNKPYTLASPPSPKYQADGANSLTDGKRGFTNYHILWQGFEGKDFEMIIDLGGPTDVNYVGAEFLQDVTSWIFMPEYVTFSWSADGNQFTELPKVENMISPQDKTPVVIKVFDKQFPSVKARFIKVFAKSVIACPEWHIGHGGKAWVFVDEVMVEKMK